MIRRVGVRPGGHICLKRKCQRHFAAVFEAVVHEYFEARTRLGPRLLAKALCCCELGSVNIASHRCKLMQQLSSLLKFHGGKVALADEHTFSRTRARQTEQDCTP